MEFVQENDFNIEVRTKAVPKKPKTEKKNKPYPRMESMILPGEKRDDTAKVQTNEWVKSSLI